MAAESELDVLLKTEQTFPPPPEFAAQANASDPGIYERADADPEAWWASLGREARLDRALGRRSSTGRTRRSRSGSPAAS